jgi:hypothetical protein
LQQHNGDNEPALLDFQGVNMEFLITFILGKAFRSGEDYARLKALSDIRSKQKSDIIPLDAVVCVLDTMLVIFLSFAVLTFF